jgi:hypothetical protein
MLSGTSKEALKDTAKQLLQDSAKGQLQELGKGLLGGKGDENKAPGAGAASPPAKKPEDEVKEKLKGLFR